MIEFDIEKALVTTYSGLGAAFAVLAFLILFTVVVRLLSRARARPSDAGTAASGYAAFTPAETPEPVPAAVAAVTELQDAGPVLPEEDDPGDYAALTDGAEDSETADDWKIYGRLEAFSSRSVGRRGG